MAFGAQEKIWGKRLLPRVQSDLARIARTIAKYEPVQMLVRTNEMPIARRLLGSVARLVEADLDDLWVRDTGPSFVIRDGRLGAVDLNFNGWGNKQTHENDADIAGFIAEQSEAQPIKTQLVGEGGGIEVDGQGASLPWASTLKPLPETVLLLQVAVKKFMLGLPIKPATNLLRG